MTSEFHPLAALLRTRPKTPHCRLKPLAVFPGAVLSQNFGRLRLAPKCDASAEPPGAICQTKRYQGLGPVQQRLVGRSFSLVSNLLLRPTGLNRCPDTLRKVEYGYLSH
jgi:hypothetical protein